MIDLKHWIDKAVQSSTYLKVLNFGLARMIPFNKPHGIRVLHITDHSIKTLLPYRRSNFNHIRGLHACALATLAEFTTGFLLVSRLDPKQYRIIMKSLNMEYHYQGKMAAHATFEATDEWLKENVYEPLKNQEAVTCDCRTEILDHDDNLLTVGIITWQIKPWTKVRTKV
jgi:acyl-coenzyme A thioesterase PaaI-like protein